MPLKDLVSYLSNRRASGALHLERGPVQKQVWLKDGMVVSANSNQPREFLGQFLINMGHLTEDQFIKAYETQKETQIFLGKILVMIGLVREEVVHSALSLKLRETLLEGFNWEDGSFVFDPTEPAPAFDGLEVRVDLKDVEREAEFRDGAWQAIRTVFPNGRVRLTVDESKFQQPPAPGSLDDKLVGLIRDHQRIDDMLLTLHANDFFLYQRLYALYRLGAVKVDQNAPVDEEMAGEAVIGDTRSPQEMVKLAERLLARGNAKEAERLARRAYEQAPAPEHRELLVKCEKALLDQLRKGLLEGMRVPILMVPSQDLKTMRLSAPEKYLLSRIDGQRDLGSIISVSPLQELEALKLFKQFIDGGLVSLR